MKSKVLVGLGTAVVFLLGIWMFPVQAQTGEVLYLADSAGTNDSTSHIYQVDLSGGQANLTLLVTLGPGAAGPGDPGWNNVDVLAASPDGQYLYFIDNSASLPDTNRLGRYDVANDSVEVLADPLVPGTFNTDQGAIAPDGTLFITRNEDESLYYVDLGETPPTVLIGKIRVGGIGGPLVNVQGGDIAFGADGTLYVLTNNPVRLYALTIPEPPYPTTVSATLLGSPGTNTFSGLAVRANGFGDLVGSDNNNNQITVLDKTNGSAGDTFPTYLGSSRFDLHNGDMTVGPLVLCTRTIGYWKNHDWGGAMVTICGATIDETDGKEILWSARGNNFSMFFAQLIAAKLNVNNSTGIPEIDDAEQWLCSQLVGYDSPFVDKSQKRIAAGYWEDLDYFNNQFECE